MNLYELTQATKELQELYENGEISEECLNDTLESLGMTPEEKAENLVKLIRNLEADSKSLKAEADHFSKRATTAKNSAAYWKDYLKVFMQTNNIPKMDAGKFKLSIRNNAPSVIVDDMDKIPSDYFVMLDPKLDKVMLKNAIKDGQEIEGAHLERSKSLTIN